MLSKVNDGKLSYGNKTGARQTIRFTISPFIGTESVSIDPANIKVQSDN